MDQIKKFAQKVGILVFIFYVASTLIIWIPNMVFAEEAVKIIYDLKKPDKDKFTINGELQLGTDSNGINPADEHITLSITTDEGVIFEETIPTGSFVTKGKEATEWIYKSKESGINYMKIRFKKDKFIFKIKASHINLPRLSEATGQTKDVTIDLQIGDDVGSQTGPFTVKKDKETGIPKRVVSGSLYLLMASESIDDISGSGNITAQEVGDAIYRHLPIISISEAHAGLYYRYIGGNPEDPKNHLVIHHDGFWGKNRVVADDTLYDFTDNGSKAYYGAYTAASLNGEEGYNTYDTRQYILKTALELVNVNPPIRYVADHPMDAKFLNTLIPYWSDGRWSGEANDIERIRCDGVVEFSYEKNDIIVWARESNKWDISQSVSKTEYDQSTPFLPKTQCALWQHNDQNIPIDANELTPNMQRGVKGTQYTNMRPSQPDNPTKVSNLTSTTHDNNGYPFDPKYRKIGIEWEDATDDQSGIWGYYIRVDADPISIPDYNDIAIQKVSLEPNSNSVFPDKNDYEPRWESQELPDGLYYVHIRSVDNAGNWCDDTKGDQCTEHLGPLCIGGECPEENYPTLIDVIEYCGNVEYDGTDSPNWTLLYNDALASCSWSDIFYCISDGPPPVVLDRYAGIIGYFSTYFPFPSYHALITVSTKIRSIWDFSSLKEKGVSKVTFNVLGNCYASPESLEKKYELEFESNMKIENIVSEPSGVPLPYQTDHYHITVDITNLTGDGILDIGVIGDVEFVPPDEYVPSYRYLSIAVTNEGF